MPLYDPLGCKDPAKVMKLVIWSLYENHMANITYDSYNILYFILLICLRRAENSFSSNNNIFKYHMNKIRANKQWTTAWSPPGCYKKRGMGNGKLKWEGKVISVLLEWVLSDSKLRFFGDGRMWASGTIGQLNMEPVRARGSGTSVLSRLSLQKLTC